MICRWDTVIEKGKKWLYKEARSSKQGTKYVISTCFLLICPQNDCINRPSIVRTEQDKICTKYIEMKQRNESALFSFSC